MFQLPNDLKAVVGYENRSIVFTCYYKSEVCRVRHETYDRVTLQGGNKEKISPRREKQREKIKKGNSERLGLCLFVCF